MIAIFFQNKLQLQNKQRWSDKMGSIVKQMAWTNNPYLELIDI